ncbi:MAG: ferredoxin:glutaredoxin reductase [Candidatus Bathyarchaeota archaeon]|nr:ferredoxin:glutaredoxin reductase [Candidatus Bathyarchaeota archaeon]
MVRQRAEADARTYGYHLNPDTKFLLSLLEGLKLNEERYDYPSCPCRLASGKFEFDRDIICPCDYRDPDVAEYGACYCGLYVRKEVFEGKTALKPIPERRPIEKQSRAYSFVAESLEEKSGTEERPNTGVKAETNATFRIRPKLWYCKQCGYVVFRDDPPYTCPICKARKEMFMEITTRIDFSG